MWLKRWQTVNCVWCKQILSTKTESPNCKLNSKAQPWYVPLLIEWHCHFVFRHFKMIFIYTVLFMWNIWYLFPWNSTIACVICLPPMLLANRDQTKTLREILEILKFFIIGPESDHWPCLSLTDWLTHSLTHSLRDV